MKVENNLEEIRDFSNVKAFPGSVGNEFDRILRRFDDLDHLPAPLFAIILAFLAILPTYPNFSYTLVILGFFLLDWVILILLPHYRISYGPPKPVALLLAVLRLLFALLPIPISLVFQIIGTALVIYAFGIEPQRLTVTRQELISPKLAKGTNLRILHLGDLHMERITQRDRLLNQRIKELKPDIILFSGDVLNLTFSEDPMAIEQAREIIREWNAPLGVYFVTGSEAVDLSHVFPELVKDLPVTWLKNEMVKITKDGQDFNLIGLRCSHRPFVDAPALSSIPKSPDLFTILLYHSPDLAPNACRLDIDLQLSGHTHGGQICFPFIGPLFTASLYGRRFRSGRYQIGPMTLYITRGLGMEGKAAPRVRVLCPPEMILWEITGSKN